MADETIIGVSKPEFEFDVFISYSSQDKAWVRGDLLRRIEQAGLRAFIDFRDFTRGAPSIKECERGVVKSRKTLIILTPNYIKSGWTEFENILVQTLDPANESLRMIPLLKADCKKPLRIGALTHIDFTDGADLELAWRQLLTALGAPPEQKPPKEPKRDEWFLAHPYPMPPNFTGRAPERAMLTEWLDADAAHPLLVLRALGGFGKSALAWHWLTHEVRPAGWPRVVWWSFYDGDASFDHFLAQTLQYLSDGKLNPTNPSKSDVAMLLQLLHFPGTLLVLDGFERLLRAFGGMDAAYQGDEAKTEANERDCMSPLAEEFLRKLSTLPGMQSKSLLTTRLCPRVLEAKGGGLWQGCREEELRQMQPTDAVEFFHARGIRGTRAEIEAACAPYGYHPLSLGILAGWIVKDLEQPGDIAAAKRLDVSGDLVQRQNHVLKVAYDCLMPERTTLLCRIACFRGPVSYAALKFLSESEKHGRGQKVKVTGQKKPSAPPSTRKTVFNIDSVLQDLVMRGLLNHDKSGQLFDLHPIVRRYAYDRLTFRDRSKAHRQLRDYFEAVPKAGKVTRLEDLRPVIELYHHTVRTGQYDNACDLLSARLIPDPLYFQFGANQLIIELCRALFPDGENGLPRLKKDSDQAWTLNALATCYGLIGQPHRAVAFFDKQNAIQEKLNNKPNIAIGLANVTLLAQLPTGAVRAAEANLHRSISLSRETEDEFQEAIGHQELARLLAYRGEWADSDAEQATSLAMFGKFASAQSMCVACAYGALGELLQRRDSQSAIYDSRSAIGSARRAVELADDCARNGSLVERDLVRAHWLLGAAFCGAGNYDEAEHHLHAALERCRRINMVDHEAEILIDLARLRAATDAGEDAQRLAEEALFIADRCEFVLQGADARLELAKLAIGRGEKSVAIEHAKEARRLARCDGPPDYTYKVAYDEAGALLEELGAAH